MAVWFQSRAPLQVDDDVHQLVPLKHSLRATGQYDHWRRALILQYIKQEGHDSCSKKEVELREEMDGELDQAWDIYVTSDNNIRHTA